MLTVEGLACRRAGRMVFRDLSFALRRGEALVLTGPNGSGKSSLLRVLAGLTPAAAGTVRLDGAVAADDPEAWRARLRYVGHLDAVKPALSVLENVSWLGGDAEAALAAIGLDRIADRPGRELSAGQRRRVALARLATGAADLWLLDEPTVGLDTDGLGLFQALVARHRAAGGLVVAATHQELGLGPATALRPADFA